MHAPAGLEGVIVAQTQISNVQADGILSYRGQRIEALVERPFLDVAQLVVTGTTYHDWQSWFDEHKHLTESQRATLASLPRQMHPLQVMISMIPVLASSLADTDPLIRGFVIAAKLPEILVSHIKGELVRLPESGHYAEQILTALGHTAADPSGQAQTSARFEQLCDAFNVAQILQIEHSLNAGTFAARVVASTLANVESAYCAGLSALSGALHGGADQEAIEMADQLEMAACAPEFVSATLASGGKVPGMGHREYKVRDPRANCLDGWAAKLAQEGPLLDVYTKLQAIEAAFRGIMEERGKPLHPNVEFYKGVVYRALGLPNDAFTAAFGLARVYGYLAHYLENSENNRIYRPQAEYVGIVS